MSDILVDPDDGGLPDPPPPGGGDPPSDDGFDPFDPGGDGDGGGGNDGGSGDGGSGGGSGGGSSGGGSGGGGSGFNEESAWRAKQANMRSVYFSIWGEYPLDSYLAGFKGLSLFEFIEHERAKPAFVKTPTFKKESQPLIDIIQVIQRLAG